MANQLLTIGYGSVVFGDLAQTYTISGNIYTEIANVSIPSAKGVNAVSWTPSGELLAIGQASGTGVELTVAAYSAGTWTNQTVSNTPTGTVTDVEWSKDSSRLAVAAGDGLYVYYRGTGNTYTRTTVSGSFDINGVDWNADDTSLAISTENSPYVYVQNRTGNTYTTISNPSTTPTGIAIDVSWSPNGNLAVAHAASPYVTIYSRSSDTLTKISNPSTLPTGDGKAVSYSPDGQILAVGHETSPYITLYTVAGTVYTKISNPATLPADDVYDLSWNNTSNKLFVASQSGVLAYTRTGNTFVADSTINGQRNISVLSVDVYSASTTHSGEASISTAVSLTATGKISTQSASVTLTSAFSVQARILGPILYVDNNYIDTGYFIQGSDFDYFEPDYIEDGYVAPAVIEATASLASVAGITATITRLQSATVNLISTSSLTVIGLRLAGTTVNLSSQATLLTNGIKQASATCTLASVSTLTNSAQRTRAPVVVLASTAQLTTTAYYVLSPAIGLTTQSSITALFFVNRLANTSLAAFNTVVSVTGRIRSDGSDMVASVTVTAVAGKIRTAATNNNLKTINPTPYTGIYIDRTDHYALLDDEEYLINNPTRIVGGATDSEWVNDAIISFWARCDDYTGGTIFSTEGTALNRENAFTLKLSPTLISLSNSYSAGTGGGSFFSANLSALGILAGEWHHYFILVDHNVGDTPSPYDVIIAVDGVDILNDDGTWDPNTNFLTAVNPIAIGIKRNRVPEPGGATINQISLTERFKGTIAQLWIGDSVGGDVLSEFYDTSNPITPFIDFGTTGRTSGNTLQQPVWYEQFNYPFTNDVSGVAFSLSSLQTDYFAPESNEEIDIDYLPAVGNQPIVGRFTLISSGDNIRYANASVASVSSLSAFAGYNKLASSTISSVATLTATPYDFTKAQIVMASEFTIASIGSKVKDASAAMSSNFTVNFDADETNKGQATLASAFTIVADSTTAQLGRAQIASNFTLTVIPYNFTKAQASIQASAELVSDGRYQARTRADATLSAVSTFSATALRYRPGTVNLNSTLILTLGLGNALRSGNIAMSAFDTVLSAGKIVEFLTENTVAVNEEQRLLRVALESTVLLVQMANGVNTITAETTDIVVAQEQAVLLAQYNMPTN
jgi:hypothetical protein